MLLVNLVQHMQIDCNVFLLVVHENLMAYLAGKVASKQACRYWLDVLVGCRVYRTTFRSEDR